MARHDAGVSAREAHPVRRALRIVLVAAVAALVLAATVFWLTGGRWFVVRTPSMGTAAPVGSLVLTRPAQVAALHVGDVIAFHPPTEPSETYTHRIVGITAQGVRTRGDINGATDPWVVTNHDIIGHATAIPALGWLVRALPLLLIGGLVLWVGTALWLRPSRRGPVRMTGIAILFALSALLLKPFINVVQLETQSEPHGAYIRVVSTGLLPVRLSATPHHGHAAPVDLSTAGRVAVSHFTGGKPGAQYELNTHLHLNTWQWVLLILFCLTPLLWTLIVGYRPDEMAAIA